MRVCVLMFTTAGPMRSTRSAKSGRICALAPGVLGVAAWPAAWKPRPKARSAPRMLVWSRFIERSCLRRDAGGPAPGKMGTGGPRFQPTRAEKSRLVHDAARHLLGGGERHLAEHRHHVLSHRMDKEARGAVLARGFGRARLGGVRLDGDRLAREPVVEDALRSRRGAG